LAYKSSKLARENKRSLIAGLDAPVGPIGVAAELGVNQRIKTFHASGLLALALLGEARAGPLEDAEAAYPRHDYATTLQISVRWPDQGGASAQYDLGVIYSDGQVRLRTTRKPQPGSARPPSRATLLASWA
jgi:hypothetical protein